MGMGQDTPSYLEGDSGFSSSDIGLKKRIKFLENRLKELEDVDRIRGLFSDVMRHDLLNRAAIILVASELLLEEQPENEELEVVNRNATDLIELIENASKLSKLESLSEVEFEKIDLKEVIDSVVEKSKPLFKGSDIIIENKVRTSTPIRANPVIKEVFFNLLTNALKYANKGKKLEIRVSEEDLKYTLSVVDNGPGIPDELKQKIFNRFERGVISGVTGSGLGLAIVKRIMELHSGQVWIEDNPDGGSIFVITIPKQKQTSKDG